LEAVYRLECSEQAAFPSDTAVAGRHIPTMAWFKDPAGNILSVLEGEKSDE
jgi:hypothetical protein